MRSKLWLLLAFVLALTAPPRVFGDSTHKSTYDKIANAIEFYVANDDDASFDQMVETLPVAIDPWLVSYTLVGRGKIEHAKKYASRVADFDGEKLRASLETVAPSVAGDAKQILDGYLDGRPRPEALKALDAASAGGNAFLEAARAVFRGYVLTYLEDWDKARSALVEGARLAETAGWLHGTIGSLKSAGLCARRLEDKSASLVFLAQLHDQYAAAGWDREAARSLGILAAAYADVGDYGGAIQRFDDALRAQEPFGAASSAVTLFNYGTVLVRAGRYARALTMFDRALSEQEDRAKIARLLQGMATARSRLHHHEDAKKLIEQALLLAREVQAEAESESQATRRHAMMIANIVGDRGSIYSRAGELEEAEKSLAEATRLFEGLKNRRGIAYTRILRASIHRKSNRPMEALQQAEQALEELSELKDSHGRASVLDEISEIQIASGALDAADATIAAILEASVDPLLRAQAFERRARVEIKRKRWRQAEAPARQAVESLALAFVGVGSLYGSVARDAQAQIFETAMRVSVRLTNTEDALHVLERARAGAFFESLEGREKLRQAAISPELADKLDKARHRISLARYELKRAESDGRLDSIRAGKETLSARKSEFATLVEQAQRSKKAAARLLYLPKTATLKQIRSRLAPEDVMVLYAFFGDRAFAISISPKQRPVLALIGKTNEIRAECEALDPRVTALDSAKTARLAELLALDVLTPKSAKRMIVSVNGPLTGIPFGVLTDLEVSYVPSGTTYHFLSRNQVPAGSKVLALGDPVYGTHGPTDEFVPSGLRDVERGRLGPLIHSKDEAETVGDVHLIGRDATEKKLRKSLKEGWRAVHLACHGVIDRDSPMYSALALSSEVVKATRDPDAHDGYLTSHEIYELEINADLVVLSACRTALGRVFKGEGLHGLPRAFMYAGAPRVIVSLWRVDDAATAVLMKRFHALWNPKDEKTKPLSTGAALKAAQQYVRDFEIEVDEEGGKKKSKPWAHPKYWAAWQLWGLPD